MNKRRFQRAVLLTGVIGLLLVGGCGLWLFQSQRHQYALNRQLIAALVKSDTQKALVLVNSGADPNTPYAQMPAPSFQQLWNSLFRRSALPINKSPTAFLVACGALWDDETFAMTPWTHPDSPRIVEAMIQQGAKPNIHDAGGWTPLLYAVSFERPKTVRILLDQGADPNLPGSDGTTALKAAQEDQNPDIIALLRRYGAKK